jgi:integrase
MPKRNSVKLTDTYVRKSIKPPVTGRVEVFDSQEDSLCLRVSSTGNMSWCVYYRLRGRNRKYTVGAYPTYSIAEARERAAEVKKAVAQGLDPVAERKKEIAEYLEPGMVEAVAQLFIDRYVEKKLKQTTARDYKTHFRLYILPEWRGRAVTSITKKDVVVLLDKVEDKAPIQCNRVHATLSKWFNWMIDERGVLDFSPIGRMKKRTPENQRSRILSEEEIRALWKAFDAKGWPFGSIAKLLLLTAKRRAEVVGMRWNEIDFENRVWLIPGGREGRTKNKIEDAVPLSDQAVDILMDLPRFEGVDLVFPAKGHVERPVSGFSKAKGKMDELSAVTDWTLHDLRRTVRSNLSALRIRKEIADKVLHHVDRTVDGMHYDWHDYLDEKREALQAWANRFENILSNSDGNGTVVSLRRNGEDTH